MPMTSALLARQAHHEAGHAVAAIHEKFGLHFAKLGDQPECLTNARLNRVWPSATAEVRFLVAGFAADRIFAPLKARRENFENQFDFARALRLVEEDHLQILLRATDQIITARWREVEALATVLMDKKFLPALEIYKILVGIRP